MASSRVRITGDDFNAIRARIVETPNRVTGEVENILQEIGADAVRDMRDTIEKSETPTGQKAYAKGERATPGRVRGRTEASRSDRPRIAGKSMRDSVDQKVTRNKNSVSLRFGWITGRPGYAMFQEYGTSNGVRGMHALTNARIAANIELRRRLGRY